jgi:hypothetical protein
MTCRGFRSWPPIWTWVEGGENKHPLGEVGILQEVFQFNINSADRCFLYMAHERSLYMGCLLIDDHAFCRQIVKLLRDYYNHPIAEIGSLDLTYTL